jgi:hypothetical protein
MNGSRNPVPSRPTANLLTCYSREAGANLLYLSELYTAALAIFIMSQAHQGRNPGTSFFRLFSGESVGKHEPHPNSCDPEDAMKILLGILAVLVIAASLFADYKWRQWIAARRRNRQ